MLDLGRPLAFTRLGEVVARDDGRGYQVVARCRHPSVAVEPHSNMAWPKSIRRSLRLPTLFALSLILAPALIVFVGSPNLHEQTAELNLQTNRGPHLGRTL
jgi:hypothetical protein